MARRARFDYWASFAGVEARNRPSPPPIPAIPALSIVPLPIRGPPPPSNHPSLSTHPPAPLLPHSPAPLHPIIVDQLFLEFVHTKLDLYKKISDPKINAVIKDRWFNRYYGRYQGANA